MDRHVTYLLAGLVVDGVIKTKIGGSGVIESRASPQRSSTARYDASVASQRAIPQ